MARAKNKTELLESSEENYNALMNLINELQRNQLVEKGVCEEWSIKDILAHLHAWHKLCLGWYEAGIKGEVIPKPAPGFTWKQTPELNQSIYEKFQDVDLDQIINDLEGSHQKVLSVIQQHNNDELFTKKRYKWTGSTSMGSYFTSSAASHYQWAMEEIKRWLRKNQLT